MPQMDALKIEDKEADRLIKERLEKMAPKKEKKVKLLTSSFPRVRSLD